MALNVLVEDGNFQPADVADALAWRQRFGLSFTVLADTDGSWAEAWGNPHSDLFVQHSYTLLDADGIVLWREEENQRAGPVLERMIEQLEALD